MTHSRRRRVVHLLADSHLGGGPLALLHLLHGFDGRFETWVYCPPGGRAWQRLAKAADHLEPLELPLPPRPRPWWRLVRQLRARQIEVVHTHGARAGVWGRTAAQAAGVRRCVHTHHGLHFAHNPRTRRLGRLQEQLLGRMTGAIIHVSEAEAALARRLGLYWPERSRVVANSIPDRAPPPPRSPGGAPLRAVAVARFDPVKAHAVLIEAMARLGGRVHLSLAGSGPLESTLRRQVEAMGLAPTVAFLGDVENVPALLEEMDVYVSAAGHEGRSLALLEALRAALPVVASRVAGHQDVVADGRSALLVDTGDAQGFAEALACLATDPELRIRLGHGARAAFLELNRFEDFVEQTAALYEDVEP